MHPAGAAYQITCFRLVERDVEAPEVEADLTVDSFDVKIKKSSAKK